MIFDGEIEGLRWEIPKTVGIIAFPECQEAMLISHPYKAVLHSLVLDMIW